MDFTKKLRSFISDIKDSAVKSPEEETLPALLVESPAVAKFKEHLVEGDSDPTKEAEVLASIEEEYYKGQETDTSQYELEALPDQVQPIEIDKKRKTLKRQLTAVSRRVSELVLENQPAYSTELDRVIDLQHSLQEATQVCKDARSNIHVAQDCFTVASLGLLANYRKRQQLIGLLKALSTINTLQRTDVRLREMVEEEDYAGAIQLCLECEQAAQALKHYNCISELSTKLQDTLEQIEESLDVALSKTCLNFNASHYAKLQAAYALLAKTQTAMDQLHMHFTSAVHNTAFQIVLGYVQLIAPADSPNYSKKNYADLCKYISGEVFTACLLDLCKALWGVMRCYHSTRAWHAQLHQQDDPDISEQEKLNRQYIAQKLCHGLVRVWGDVQAKVKVYLLSIDLSHFQYDQFIQVLDIISRLMQIGEEFCGSTSEALQESVRKQSLAYFRNYHRARLDELRMFLENEAWELCPVKSSFSVLMLQEFKFLRFGTLRSDSFKTNTTVDKLSDKIVPEGGGDAITGIDTEIGNSDPKDNDVTPKNSIQNGIVPDSASDLFSRYGEDGNPFDVQQDDDQTEDLFDTNGVGGRLLSADSDSDDDIAEELKRDYVDEQTGETPTRRPIGLQRTKSRDRNIPLVTNTTINVCRLFGKYMQMMTVLKPIAFDVTICLSQLFDYYLYTVYSFFILAEEQISSYAGSLSPKLWASLKRIRDNLITEDLSEQASQEKVMAPSISPMVNLSGTESMHGLAERVVATESLAFLAQQFELLQSHLEALIPAAKKAFLTQFYSQTVSVTGELRGPVYHTVTMHAVSTETMLQMMATVRFDIKDIMSQHSPYVDAILQELGRFAARVDHVTKRAPLPQAVSDVLWTNAIAIVNAGFVEGFGSVRKCSNEGRALMQLDYQQFLLKLEMLTQLRPVPGREFVEAYIKAYYLPEAQLESWLRDHKEYSVKQLQSLVHTVPHINKKSRQRLLLMLDDMDKKKRNIVDIIKTNT